MKLRMFQMHCGESILAYNDEDEAKKECLLIDCGSQSKYGNVLFENVKRECSRFDYENRNAMITHFHKDHINGFMYITDDKDFKFKKVYIPYIFTAGKHYNIIDYMLILKYLESVKIKKDKRTDISVLNFLKQIVIKKTSIKLVARGCHFDSCGKICEALWPVPKELIYGDKFIDENFPRDFLENIFKISDEIAMLYIEYARRNDHDDTSQAVYTEIINGIEEEIIDLWNYDIVWNSDSLRNDDSLLNDDNSFSQIDLDKKICEKIRKQMKNKDNDTSIVFQTKSKENTGVTGEYLLTGDVGSRILRDIVYDMYSPSRPLHNHFFAIKAPHHGTHSHYPYELFGGNGCYFYNGLGGIKPWDLYDMPERALKSFFELNSSITTEIVFISNGFGGHAGEISPCYPANNKFFKICTNCNPKKCGGLINESYYETTCYGKCPPKKHQECEINKLTQCSRYKKSKILDTNINSCRCSYFDIV